MATRLTGSDVKAVHIAGDSQATSRISKISGILITEMIEIKPQSANFNFLDWCVVSSLIILF